MNWVNLKDLFCYVWFVGAVLTSWSLTQVVPGSNALFTKNFAIEFSYSVRLLRKSYNHNRRYLFHEN